MKNQSCKKENNNIFTPGQKAKDITLLIESILAVKKMVNKIKYCYGIAIKIINE